MTKEIKIADIDLALHGASVMLISKNDVKKLERDIEAKDAEIAQLKAIIEERDKAHQEFKEWMYSCVK